MSSPVLDRLHHRRASAPVWVVLLVLAVGGFGIGTTEFVSMGLLPDIATDIGVSVPTAGHLISAYALGVVVGAPLIAALAARLSRRTLLIELMVAFVVGNGATALAGSYLPLLLARFVAGLPHGAYFGVGSLVAASLVAPERRARAIGAMMLGLSVANVVGVPAATWLGQSLGWRSAYVAVVAIGVVTVIALVLFAPDVAADRDATVARELGALRRPQVLLTLLIGTVGFGGMFAVYSYITPTMTHVAGLPADRMPIVLALFGLGMVAGNLIGPRFVDRSVTGSLVLGGLATTVLFVLFAFAAHDALAATAVLVGLTMATTVMVLALQTRLMDVAGDAQALAASLNHSALNLANAGGAWLGGITIAAGYGWTSTAWDGVGLALAGLAVMAVSLRLAARAAGSADVPVESDSLTLSRA